MSVQVSAGSAFVLNTYGAAQGYYTVVNDGTVLIALDASHPNFGRVDTIVLRVYDSQYSGTDNFGQLEKITGSPGPSPAVGPIPDNCIVLATIFVGASASAITSGNISSSLRQYARFNSSLVNAVESLTSTTLPGSPYQGQMAIETDTDAVKISVNGVWRTLSPATAINVTSGSRPSGVRAKAGMILFETDTKRYYTYDGVKWNYLAGGGGEFITNTFTGWTGVYRTVFGTYNGGQQPLTLWKDAEGRYNLEGMLTNNVPISSWGYYGIYIMCALPAGTYPYYDQRAISAVVAPTQGNSVSHILIRGSTQQSVTPGAPGHIMWQSTDSQTWYVEPGMLQIMVPRISWPAQ